MSNIILFFMFLIEMQFIKFYNLKVSYCRNKYPVQGLRNGDVFAAYPSF